MQHSDRVEAAERELGALGAAVAAGDLSAPVPTCPDWTVEDLAHHVGEFLGFWTHVLCDATGTDKPDFPEPPTGEATHAWLAQRSSELLAALRRTEADTPSWTWFDADQTAGFVARRVACELAIHRYDAESARGTCGPIEPHLAVDAVDETFEALITRRDRTGVPTGQTLHLHGNDEDLAGGTGAEWLVALHPDRIDVEHAHAKGDLALRGTASDLVLLLYGRPALGPVQRFGDESVLDLWYGEFIF